MTTLQKLQVIKQNKHKSKVITLEELTNRVNCPDRPATFSEASGDIFLYFNSPDIAWESRPPASSSNFRFDDDPLINELFNIIKRKDDWQDITFAGVYIKGPNAHPVYVEIKNKIKEHMATNNVDTLDKFLVYVTKCNYQDFYGTSLKKSYSPLWLPQYQYDPSQSGYNKLRHQFARLIELYNCAIRDIWMENDFENVFEISEHTYLSAKLIPVLTHYWPQPDGNTSVGSDYTQPKLFVKPILTVYSTSDEHTRNFLNKADIKIKHNNNFMFGPMKATTPSGSSTVYDFFNIYPVNPTNQITITNASGFTRNINLFNIRYKSVEQVKAQIAPGERRFNIETGTGDQGRKIYMPSTVLIFANEGTDVLKHIHIDNPAAQITKLWENEVDDYSELLSTIATGLIFVNHNYQEINYAQGADTEVHQPKKVTAAFQNIAMITTDGQAMGTLVMAFDKVIDANYTFSFIVDKTNFIDTVYVLGNKI